jgi:hypothetical protein
VTETSVIEDPTVLALAARLRRLRRNKKMFGA